MYTKLNMRFTAWAPVKICETCRDSTWTLEHEVHAKPVNFPFIAECVWWVNCVVLSWTCQIDLVTGGDPEFRDNRVRVANGGFHSPPKSAGILTPASPRCQLLPVQWTEPLDVPQPTESPLLPPSKFPKLGTYIMGRTTSTFSRTFSSRIVEANSVRCSTH